jgi:hypothetical protein
MDVTAFFPDGWKIYLFIDPRAVDALKTKLYKMGATKIIVKQPANMK